MDDLLKLIHEDIKEVKANQLDLIKQGAVHNHLLKEHERRSLALEAQMAPVRIHVTMIETALKIGGFILTGAIGTFLITGLTRYLSG